MKTKLNNHDRFNEVRFMMKVKQDNNVTDCIGTVYAEIKNELS